MTTQELTGFRTLYQVRDDEREEAEERARLIASSDDGEVIELNKPLDDEDDGD